MVREIVEIEIILKSLYIEAIEIEKSRFESEF